MELRLKNVTKIYSAADGGEAAAVDDVSLELAPGENLLLKGPSGSGKTTLLNLIAGLTRPTRGRIFLDGKDIWSLGDARQCALRAEKLGFVYQFPSLIPSLTVLENLMLPVYFAGRDAYARKKALTLLAALGLKGMENRYPHQLSGGQQRRTASARAFMNDPELVLADEPTGDLDEETGETVLDFFGSAAKERGTGVILVTHTPAVPGWIDRRFTMIDGTCGET